MGKESMVFTSIAQRKEAFNAAVKGDEAKLEAHKLLKETIAHSLDFSVAKTKVAEVLNFDVVTAVLDKAKKDLKEGRITEKEFDAITPNTIAESMSLKWTTADQARFDALRAESKADLDATASSGLVTKNAGVFGEKVNFKKALVEVKQSADTTTFVGKLVEAAVAPIEVATTHAAPVFETAVIVNPISSTGAASKAQVEVINRVVEVNPIPVPAPVVIKTSIWSSIKSFFSAVKETIAEVAYSVEQAIEKAVNFHTVVADDNDVEFGGDTHSTDDFEGLILS